MMKPKQKLELMWIGKENRPQLEPRILLEEPERSCHAKHRISEKDIFDNKLIFGDNLLALKALEAEFAGKVKCVFIDPPYNTGSAFTHYDDGLEHSIWLSLMRDRLEDYVVSGLVDFDDISYDDHANLLYDLAAQTVNHFKTYLSEEETRKVLRCYQRDIARFIHSQMQVHYWEEAAGYDTVVSKGYTDLKETAYTYNIAEPPFDYHVSPSDKSNMAKYLFNGFERCLYAVGKFDSDAERRLAVILERDTLKWFRPVKGQFQIFYRHGADHLEYQPDFVAEASETIFMLEPKIRKEMEDEIVLAKRDSAVQWCTHATNHALNNGGKPWRYLLIPHDEIVENITLDALAQRFCV